MTSFVEARALVLGSVSPLGIEVVDLDRLGGRVFAEPLLCPFDVPQFDNSQVDGYAVDSRDGKEPRTIVGISAAGDAAPTSVGRGEAVRIFTGAPVPHGVDAVVMQEEVHIESGKLRLDRSPAAGEMIRRRGEEIAQGARFDFGGRLATPALVGLAASFGQTEFSVYRRPKVAVVATGSELVWPGQPLLPGQVYASNPYAIAEALRMLGMGDVTVVRVGDDPSETRRVLEEALVGSDVLITLGGISVGDRDYVRPSLEDLKVEDRLWRVDMKPGKPFYFGSHGVKAVFGLPGNPVSALVTFQTLVRPAIRKILGLREPEEETTVRLGTLIERTDLRYEFVRASVRDGIATPLEHQGSHMQTGLAFADGLLHLPAGVARFDEGSSVRVTPLRWGLG